MGTETGNLELKVAQHNVNVKITRYVNLSSLPTNSHQLLSSRLTADRSLQHSKTLVNKLYKSFKKYIYSVLAEEANIINITIFTPFFTSYFYSHFC